MLTDHEERDPFIRFFHSMEVDQEYIEQRKKHYPEEWDNVGVGQRIKFRMLAQMKLENTSKKIEENMKINDFNKLGLSCAKLRPASLLGLLLLLNSELWK